MIGVRMCMYVIAFATYWPVSRPLSSASTSSTSLPTEKANGSSSNGGKSVSLISSAPLSLSKDASSNSSAPITPPTPNTGTGSTNDHIYRRFSYGSHCEVFMLDVRSYRSSHQIAANGRPYIRTMLGDTQLSWLKSSVVESKAAWKFIVSSVPLSFPTGDFPPQPNPCLDGWAGDGAADELLAIVTHFNQHCVKNYIFLTGIYHIHITYTIYHRYEMCCLL
jgi:hypothetical protein